MAPVASGPSCVFSIHWIADAEGAHLGHELGEEPVVDVGVDDESLGGDARLAVVDHARGDRRRRRGVDIRRRHDDERVAAAELDD